MQGKNIVIVGGSTGIGAALAHRCAGLGAAVSTYCRTQSQHTAPNIQHQTFDVLSSALTAEQLPEQIDGFVYCPGSIQLGPLRGVKAEQMRADFELNTLGAVTSMQAALPGLKKGNGSAVFFSTIAVQRGIAMHTSIAAAKGALEALVRTWAAELAPTIRVNCIAPALTDTPLAARLLANDAKREAMANMYPLARVGTAEDMAAAAAMLLSDDSGWVTGQVLHVDGGLSSCQK